MSSNTTKEEQALACPNCGGTAMEARASKAIGKQTLLTGYFWYCFNDGYTQSGVDCEFEGPERATSAEALAAWNALPREKRDVG